jgi:hypothetical protein
MSQLRFPGGRRRTPDRWRAVPFRRPGARGAPPPRSLHSNPTALTTSIAESAAKPMRATLPARIPAPMATTTSTTFHRQFEDWNLDDPAGQDINHVRPIGEEINAWSNA